MMRLVMMNTTTIRPLSICLSFITKQTSKTPTRTSKTPPGYVSKTPQKGLHFCARVDDYLIEIVLIILFCLLAIFFGKQYISRKEKLTNLAINRARSWKFQRILWKRYMTYNKVIWPEIWKIIIFLRLLKDFSIFIFK